jgi:[acyl-carrier-protein] S-malonyltransferase
MKFAILFPGQGSQKVGMGLDLIEKSPKAKELFKILDNLAKRDLSNIFLNGPQDELNQTKNTQPSIITVSIALSQLLDEKLKEKKLSLDIVGTCGHSLGELTALWYSNVLSLGDTINLVLLRGELMQNAPSGAMAAILNLDLNQIESLLNEEIFKGKIIIANYNSPNQFVISGEKSAFETIPERVKALGGKAIILPVSGAFHSPLMNESSKSFTEALSKISNVNNATIPIFQNLDGQASTDSNIILDKLKKQMTSSVFWTQTITNLVKQRVDAVIEVGPGKVLTGLVKKINPDLHCYNIFDYQSLEEFISIYESKLSKSEP